MASNKSTSPNSNMTFCQKFQQILMLPMTIALILSCISTAIKTAAWYGQTIIPDETLFPLEWPPHDPQYRDVVITTLKTLLSWSIALFEYVPLTLANSVADQAHINLTNLRGAIEAMDLGWFVLFLNFAKGVRLSWHQWVGLAMAGLGCAIVNKPDWLFPEFDKKVEIIQTKIGEDIVLFFEKMSNCFAKKKEEDEIIDPEAIKNSRQNFLANDKLNDLQLPIPTFTPPIQIIDGKPHIVLTKQVVNENNEGELEGNTTLRKTEVIIFPPIELKDESTSSSQNKELNELDTPVHLSFSASSTRIFVVGWIIGQILFYGLAVFMFIEHKKLLAILSLTASATGVKTIAWYLHTVLGNRQLLPPSLTPKNPKTQRFAFATVKVLMSWFIALGEYIPLTLANRSADTNGISLAKVRGAIEAMDLIWLVAFMMMVKGEKLRWQHLLGLTVAGAGVGVANTDTHL